MAALRHHLTKPYWGLQQVGRLAVPFAAATPLWQEPAQVAAVVRQQEVRRGLGARASRLPGGRHGGASVRVRLAPAALLRTP
ncbi:hypothetical protein ACFWMU_27885 [Streptomyces sp. NPDC058357]|uniref:hypothetical protein n=1 Tax=unclassified Streptomyces TaxID=2593676 RepID=UPI00364EBD68